MGKRGPTAEVLVSPTWHGNMKGEPYQQTPTRTGRLSVSSKVSPTPVLLTSFPLSPVLLWNLSQAMLTLDDLFHRDKPPESPAVRYGGSPAVEICVCSGKPLGHTVMVNS
jgi:hypothetical protein